MLEAMLISSECFPFGFILLKSTGHVVGERSGKRPAYSLKVKKRIKSTNILSKPELYFTASCRLQILFNVPRIYASGEILEHFFLTIVI